MIAIELAVNVRLAKADRQYRAADKRATRMEREAAKLRAEATLQQNTLDELIGQLEYIRATKSVMQQQKVVLTPVKEVTETDTEKEKETEQESYGYDDADWGDAAEDPHAKGSGPEAGAATLSEPEKMDVEEEAYSVVRPYHAKHGRELFGVARGRVGPEMPAASPG